MDERINKEVNRQGQRQLEDQVGAVRAEAAAPSGGDIATSARTQLPGVQSVQIEGETLVGLSFSLVKNQVFSAGGLDVARAEIVHAYMATAEDALQAARAQMAKEAQVEADLLVVAVGIDQAHLEVSLLLPAGAVEAGKLKELRSLGRLAKESMGSALNAFSTEQALLLLSSGHAGLAQQGVEGQAESQSTDPDSGADGKAGKRGKGKSNPFDRVSSALGSALESKKRPGEITVSVWSGDEADAEANYQVPRRETVESEKVEFANEEVPITLEVLHPVNQKTREVKEAGASARVRASLSTGGVLPTQLRLLEGGHAVTVMARRRKFAVGCDAAEPMMLITGMASLDNLWGGEFGGLRMLRQVLDGLDGLVERAKPPVGKETKSDKKRR